MKMDQTHNFTTKLISSELTHHIRKNILWPHIKNDHYSLDVDELKDTFHLGVFVENQIVSCATFYPQNTDKAHAKNAYRLRGMATDINYSRNGYGMKIMTEAFNILKNRNCDLIWCNARLIAFPFYQYVGFEAKGDLFDISDIGPHYYMYKRIK